MGKIYGVIVQTGLPARVDFNDPLSVLLAKEGNDDAANEMHEYWLAGTHRRATSENDRSRSEPEPNIDKYRSDADWEILTRH